MCCIVGLFSQHPVNQALYDALTILQHRGQDAAGMVTCDQRRLYLHKGKGLVRDVFQEQDILQLQGNIGIGHVRYPTAGCYDSAQEAQPFYVNAPFGIALAHNGNLTNAKQLTQELIQQDHRHLNTDSDSEVLLNVFAHELQRAVTDSPLTPDQVFAAVAGVHRRCRGAYAVTALIFGHGLVAFRDPYGIRPLVYGERTTEQGKEYLLASESVALEGLDFPITQDVQPGEAIYITPTGELHRKQCASQTGLHPCLFELVYLSRPDSFIDGISVYKFRLHCGKTLANKILREWPYHPIDVVIPIPDTSRTAAYPLAQRLGVKYREGFVKNRYIGRTFIMSGQTQRRRSIRRKLNAISLEFKDKNVLLVDDSIVRGNTAREIVQMARDAGAKKVYFASAAPKVIAQNVYGIDMPTRRELIGYQHTDEEICQQIGADDLIFHDLDALVAAAREGNPTITRFEDSVFTGDYITGDIDEAYLQALESSGRLYS